MSPRLVADAYVCFAVGTAWFIGRTCFPAHRNLITRVAWSWAIVSSLLFLSPGPATFMIATALALAIIGPHTPCERILYYCAMLPAVPAYASLIIPFPGLNYLYILSYPTLVGLVVLLPAMFSKASTEGHADSSLSSHKRLLVLAFCYLLLVAALDFRSTSLTNGMRQTVDYLTSYGIVILALGRLSTTEKTAENAVLGMLLAGLFLLGIGATQLAHHWYLYNEMARGLSHTGEAYYNMFPSRGGHVRVPGTMYPIPFGIYMALCGAISLGYVSRINAAKFPLLLFFLFVWGASLSRSRAALIAMPIVVIIVGAYSERLVRYRKALLLAAVAGGVIAFVIFNLGTDILSADKYGTISYRIDLIGNSMDSISKHLLWGTPNFLSNAQLQQSRQGQGIIDIVNAYLGVLLRYGLAGLLLYILPLGIALRRLVRYRWDCERAGDDSNERLARAGLALLIPFALAIGTVSLTDRLSYYYWILVVLASGISARPLQLAAAARGKSPSQTTSASATR